MSYTETFVPETNTRADIDATTGALVVEFGANWCSHCQAAQAHIRAAFDKTGTEARHIKVEDGKGLPLGRSFGVKLWPTLIFLKNGTEVARLTRPESSDAVAQALKQIGTAA